MSSSTNSSKQADRPCPSAPSLLQDNQNNNKRPKLTSSSLPSSSQFTDTAPDPPKYDFTFLIANDDDLRKFATGPSTISFRNHRKATLCLTRAILRHHFNLTMHIPKHHLIPTVPNRQQYLEWAASLLPTLSKTQKITLLDIGTGPSCIYPLLAARLYPEWNQIIATDTDLNAIESAQYNVDQNNLNSIISVVHINSNDESIFPSNYAPTLTVCNPPFHDTEDHENNGHDNENDNNDNDNTEMAGTKEQMMTKGGEVNFIKRIAKESVHVTSGVWFTSLMGCKSSIPKITAFLRTPSINALHVRTVRLAAGGRTVRWAVAWSFGFSLTSHSSIIEHDKNSPWRMQISITPSRKFANQLTETDIIDVTILVFNHLHWFTERNDDDDIHKSKSNNNTTSRTVQLYNMEEEEDTIEKNNIQSIIIHCTGQNGNRNGAFVLTLKVERRTKMTVNDFEQLCQQLTQDIPKQLDELSS